MSVPETARDINSIEQIIFGWCCQLGRELMRGVFEDLDLELREARDKSIYHNKQRRKTTLKTIMGEVEYWRTQYEYHPEEGLTEYVYLLDEELGLVCKGQLSGSLSAVIAQAACESSYRSVSRQVSEMTGQVISHTGAWNVVQMLGEQLDAREKEAAALALKGEGVGELESKLLFEEQDGIHLNLQGSSRKEHGPNKEMKVAIAYDGYKKTGKKRYELTNKVACANFECIEKFVNRKEGVIAGAFNVDEIAMRLLGGDGAKWIRRSQTDEMVHFQLDQFHRNKALKQYVSNPEIQEDLRELLYSNEIDLLMHVIEVHCLSTDDEEERDQYAKLLTYYQNNRDGLVPCHRRGIEYPEPPKGVEYRRMGTMESNIFTIIGNRMKGRRACWSINGANNLARLLCLKHTKKLTSALQTLTELVLPERYAEDIAVKMSAAQAPKREGKGYDGYRQMSVPSSMKWLKDLASIRTVIGG